MCLRLLMVTEPNYVGLLRWVSCRSTETFIAPTLASSLYSSHMHKRHQKWGQEEHLHSTYVLTTQHGTSCNALLP